MIICLMRRRERDLEIPGELPLASLPGPFRDVVGDSVDSSQKLGAEARCSPTDGSPEGRPVARDRKDVGLSPSIDLSKRVHAGMMRR
jgi:hypothetical protein